MKRILLIAVLFAIALSFVIPQVFAHPPAQDELGEGDDTVALFEGSIAVDMFTYVGQELKAEADELNVSPAIGGRLEELN